MIFRFLRERILRPVRQLLRQGTSPEEAALCIALGTGISICPLIGLPTILCTLLAAGLRLNLPLIQSVNYSFTIPQWALLLPFIRIGEWMYKAEPLPLSLTEIKDLLDDNFFASAGLLWRTALHAASAWLLVAIPLSLIVYALLLPVLRKMKRRRAITRQRRSEAS